MSDLPHVSSSRRLGPRKAAIAHRGHQRLRHTGNSSELTMVLTKSRDRRMPRFSWTGRRCDLTASGDLLRRVINRHSNQLTIRKKQRVPHEIIVNNEAHASSR